MEERFFIQIGISLLLGLLVGLQRERTEASVAGIRTFPLISAFGTLCAWLAESHGGWIIAAGLAAVATLLVVGNLARMRAGDLDPGLTTEIAALLVFALGALVVVGPMPVAVALTGAVALLLHFKQPLHRFVAQIGDADIKAIMQFALVTLVILPVLPDRTYGPYHVLNPREIWLMVVLIVSISLAGYVAFKICGARTGTLVGGVIGGLISSTATTASFARQTKENSGTAKLSAVVIMIASGIVYMRAMLEVAAVAPAQFARIAPPLASMMAVCALIAAIAYRFVRSDSPEFAAPRNPAQLKSAMLFGGLYAVVILAVAAAMDCLGSSGMFLVAVISGLTDMDAITLSTAQLTDAGRVDASTCWRVILTASMSNLVFKAGIVAVLGGQRLFRRIALLFGSALLAAGAILWFWPD